MRRAFTILELLVVIVILAVLIGLLGTALGKVRSSARSFVCKNKLKTVAFEFLQFAEAPADVSGSGGEASGGAGFRIEDFQERLYGIDEFWDAGPAPEAEYEASRQPLMCPSGPRELRRHPGLPCSGYAVTPAANVSIAFNMRLHRASVTIAGRPVLKPVTLKARMLEHGSVPLAMDVDAGTAVGRYVLPYYTAPAAGDAGLYGSGLFWFPRGRHDGEVNACFVGGHVLASRSPETEAQWDWAYQPPAD